MGPKKILIVEDEEDIRELIHFNLFKERYQVFCARDGNEALHLVSEQIPDLILLDLMLPKIDGMTVCLRLKEDQLTKNIPIIMLTAKGSEEDIIKGLEAGADDYITKPFVPKILLARIKAVFRRIDEKSLPTHNIFKIYGLQIDSTKRKVEIEGERLDLTFSEFQLLFLLAQRPGWVFTRSQIVDSIRGENHAITDRSVDVQIVGLRKKLQDQGHLIETVRGVGYRFKEYET